MAIKVTKRKTWAAPEVVTAAKLNDTANPIVADYDVSTIAAAKAQLYTSASTGDQFNVAGYYAAGDGGGGPLYVDKADTTTADNGVTVFVAADGTRLKRTKINFITLKECGCYLDDSHDDTTRLQAALALSMNDGITILGDSGVAKITAALDFGQSVAASFGGGPVLIGSGRGKTTIKQYTANTPIVLFGGSFGRLESLDLVYSTQQTVSQTSSVGIRFYAAQWFTIKDVNINYSCTVMDIPQVSVVASGNVIFNGTIEDICAIGFRKKVIDFQSYNGGSGGMTIRNVWSLPEIGSSTTATETPFYFTSFSDSKIAGINVQNQFFPQAIYFAGGGNNAIDGVHIEDCTMNAAYSGIFHIDNSCKVSIRNVTLRTMQLIVGTASNLALFRITGGSQVIADTIVESDTTKTATTYLLATDANASNRFIFEDDPPASWTGYNLGGPTTVIKRVGDAIISMTQGFEGLQRFTTIGAPSTGTWARGDIAYEIYPTSGGYVGYVCTLGGSPGTWKGFGLIA